MRELLSLWCKRVFISVTCLLPVLGHAAYFSGEMDVRVADYFKEKRAEITYQLQMGNELIRLKQNGELDKANLKTGDKVSIEGHKIKGFNGQSFIEVKAIHKLSQDIHVSQPKQRKVLALLLDFNDKKASDYIGENEVYNTMYLDDNSVRKIYLKSSYNQVDFIPDPNGDGKPDVYTVKLNSLAGDACSPSTWAKAAKEQAENDGINTSLYQHLMYILPKKVGCRWAGLGHIGCSTQCSSWLRVFYKLVYAHELGHNLGLHHASTNPENTKKVTCEYCDNSNFMGSGGYYPVNGPHRKQLAWFNPYPKLVKKVSKTSKVRMAALDRDAKGIKRGAQLVEVDTGNISLPYYLSYRVGDTVFGMNKKYNHRISIHRYPGPGKRTLLIKTLAKGEEFVSPEEGIKIRPYKINDVSARVKVIISNKCIFPSYPCQVTSDAAVEQLNGKANHLVIDVPENTQSLKVSTVPGEVTKLTTLYLNYGELTI